MVGVPRLRNDKGGGPSIVVTPTRKEWPKRGSNHKDDTSERRWQKVAFKDRMLMMEGK